MRVAIVTQTKVGRKVKYYMKHWYESLSTTYPPTQASHLRTADRNLFQDQEFHKTMVAILKFGIVFVLYCIVFDKNQKSHFKPFLFVWGVYII